MCYLQVVTWILDFCSLDLSPSLSASEQHGAAKRRLQELEIGNETK